MVMLKELMSLTGRRVMITGVTGGIGHKMAEAVAEMGGNLVLVDHPESDYSAVLQSVTDLAAVEVDCIDCDLEDSDSRVKLIKELLNNQKGLDVLVNNAAFVGTSGLDGWVTDFEQQSIDTWRRALEVNLTAAFDLSKGLYPKLKQSGHGSIINVASIYGISGPDYSLYEDTAMGNPAAYAASKGGLLQLTRWLATTLAPEVRVNAISPGGVFRNQPKIFVARYQNRTPLQRMAVEDDFKGVMAYLASDLSSYVTGQNMIVDGGWTCW